MICPNEIPSDYKAYRKQQRRWSCGPMQLWAAARLSVTESTLPLLHKSYLNIFFFGVRMLATNVISFTFYSVLVPLMLLEYAQEEESEARHHRFMPWWAIVWLPLLVDDVRRISLPSELGPSRSSASFLSCLATCSASWASRRNRSFATLWLSFDMFVSCDRLLAYVRKERWEWELATLEPPRLFLPGLLLGP